MNSYLHPRFLTLCLGLLFSLTAATALAQTPVLVTVATADTNSAAGFSSDPVVSGNGRFVVFHSFASNLVVQNDVNGRRDVFVRDLQTGTTTLVSVNLVGNGTGSGTSEKPTISADGRFVAFESDAANLVANDTNSKIDVFVRDLQAGTTTLISFNNSGSGSANGTSFNAVISPNAKYVAFTSSASNIVDFDNNDTIDIFIRQLNVGQTRMVTCDLPCTSPGNDASFMPELPKDKAARAVFSVDGKFLVFESRATNLVLTPDANGNSSDVFVRDLDVGITSLMSINQGLTASANSASTTPIISGNGRFIIFQSIATDLTANDTLGGLDLFVRDRQTNSTSLVSVTTTNTGSNIGNSQFFPVASDDGRYVIFQSDANTYVGNDSNNNIDVFRRDLQTNTTALITVNTNGGTNPNSSALGSVMSADGRFVAFIGFGGEFSSTPDTNSRGDVYVRDVNAGTTTLVSINNAGTAAVATAPVISADGRFVLFESDSTDIVPVAPNSTNIFSSALNGRVKLDATAMTVNETSGTANFSVTRTGSTSDAVTVQYATVSGSAKAPSDYATTAGSLTFAIGETSKSIVIPIVNDAIDEVDEKLSLLISDFNGTPGSLASAVLTITDDDDPPTISIDDVTVVEGSTGTTVAEFTLTLSSVSGKDVSVATSANGLTATLVSDFSFPFPFPFSFPQVVIGAGTTSVKFPVQIVADRIFEDDETFTLTISNPVNATIARAQGLGTIQNDDAFPVMTVSDVAVAEGQSGIRLLTFSIKLSNPSQQPISVHLATADGTAQAGNDYIALQGTLTIVSAITAVPFSIPIIGDLVVEPNETFFLNLSNANGATLGDSQAVGTIVNDDLPPALLIEEGSTRGAAIDTILGLRDPFPLVRSFFGPDLHTRITLFAFNLELIPGEGASAVTVAAEEEFGPTHSLPVEFVGPVPEVVGLSRIVVRLPDTVGKSELKLRVFLRGQGSNVGTIRIVP